MKKLLLVTALFALLISFSFAQKPYKVVFYNLENFFDTINDPEVHDDEFTPEGPKKWNSAKYNKKLANTERVFFDIAAINKDYPVIIGVSEVENRSVLEDIIATRKLAPANYRISHFDSPEARGVDVAFLYRPDVFKIEGEKAVRTVIPSLPDFKTRDILTLWGTIENEPFFFMVAHWPSRLGGKEASEFKRIAVGQQMRSIADSVMKANPNTKVVMMGDFNDDPTDKSIAQGLGAKFKLKDLKEDYAAMIVKSYKSRSEQSRAMFLLSSESFLQAYKRAQYMKQYTSYRKTQGEEIKVKADQLSTLNTKLDDQKIEKQKLVKEQEQERLVLQKEKVEQEKLSAAIQKDKKKIAKEIKGKQQEAKENKDCIQKGD